MRHGPTVEVTIAEDAGSAPISVVEYAASRCQEPGGYDQVFCVFDKDRHESFDRARERARGLRQRRQNPWPIRAIVSVPCFEVWPLLHFERCDRPFSNCAEVTAYIRQRSHIPNYIKADPETARNLMDRLATALENAVWLERRGAINDQNPYTEVHHVLDHLSAMQEIERRSPT